MAKELPYFRFTAGEWLNGDISLESNELKGLFIDVCSYYWFKDCSIKLAMLYKRFSNTKALIDELFTLGIIKHDEESDFITIHFLNEQFDVLSEARKRRQKAGSKGGKKKASNAKAKPQQSSSYKDKEKDKDKENDSSSSQPEKKAGSKKADFIDSVVSVWCEKYLQVRGDEYEITTKGKERSAAGKIIRLNKKKFPQAGSAEALKRIGVMFELCLGIDNDWLYQNMSMMTIISKYNEIKTILNGQNRKNSGAGVTDIELEEILAGTLSEDK